jgi:hypothetical protein
MKKILTSFFLIVLVLALATACKPALPGFTAGQEIGADANAQTTLKTGIATQTLAETNADQTNPAGTSGLNFSIDASTLFAAADQTVILRSTNGLFDSASFATGFYVYALTATAATDGAVSRGVSIPYTTQIVPEGNGGSSAILTINLSYFTGLSSTVEIYVSATALTANGGTLRLNTDGDAIMGEANDDDVYVYRTVTGTGLVAPAGAYKNPREFINIVAYDDFGLADATAIVYFENSDGGYTDMTADSLKGGFLLQKMNATGGFDTVPFATATYDNATGALTLTIATAPVLGEVYRWVITPASINESAAIDGFIHGLLLDGNANGTYQLGEPIWFWDGIRESDQSHEVAYSYLAINGPGGDFAPFASAGDMAPRADATANPMDLTYLALPKTFGVSQNGGAVTTVTLNQDYIDLDALVSAIDAALPPAYTVTATDRDGDGAADDGFMIQSTTAGADQYITISDGVTFSALTDLGLTAGTYVGRDYAGVYAYDKATVQGASTCPASDTYYTTYWGYYLLKITVNGVQYTSQIENNTSGTVVLTRAQVANELSADFAAAGVTATVNGNYIVLTKNNAGPDTISIVSWENDYIGFDAGQTDTGAISLVANYEFAGVSAFSANGSYYLELNFARSFNNSPVNKATVLPAGMIISNASFAPVPWVTTDMVWLSDSLCRIKMPAGFTPSGNYQIKVLPTVKTSDGISYGADQGKDGYFYLSDISTTPINW